MTEGNKQNTCKQTVTIKQNYQRMQQQQQQHSIESLLGDTKRRDGKILFKNSSVILFSYPFFACFFLLVSILIRVFQGHWKIQNSNCEINEE